MGFQTIFAVASAQSLLRNEYVTIALVCALAAAAIKMVDQYRQNKRKIAQEFGQGARELGLTEIPEFVDDFARYDSEALWAKMHEWAKRVNSPQGFADVLCEIYEKTFSLAMKNQYTKLRLKPVVAKELLGFLLDDKTRVGLVEVAKELHEFGSKELQQFFAALSLNDLDAAEKAFQDFVALLKNSAGLDKVLMDRAEVTVPRLMKDQANAEKLKALVNGPPSVEEQIAALQAKLPPAA